MLRTVEGTIDADGTVHLREAVRLPDARRALVTILDEAPSPDVPAHTGANEAALLAASALAETWDRPEEDEAWRHLDELPDLDEARP